MSDVVITVPKDRWKDWLEEGDLAGTEDTGQVYMFSVPTAPNIRPGERVYIVAGGRLRGWAPLLEVGFEGGKTVLYRKGGATACTIPESIRGFQAFRYRWWQRSQEIPFPNWKTEGF